MPAKKRVLVIDNEEGICRMVEAVLTDHGYEVATCTRSFEAVEKFTPGRWDLVISDVKMPGMNGLEVLQKIKEMARESNIILVENRFLARELYAQVEEGQEIPETLYTAVAEVHAYVYSIKGKI